MVHIEKISDDQGCCCQCNEQATVKINDMYYCPKCSDDILIRTITKCSKALQQISLKIQLSLNSEVKNG